jgi:putative addiction module component (TIGR02574 family)
MSHGIAFQECIFYNEFMDSAILAKEALKLPRRERAQIADALWQSLDSAEQTQIDKAWLKESRERLDAYRSGKLKAEDGESVLKQIQQDLRG